MMKGIHPARLGRIEERIGAMLPDEGGSLRQLLEKWNGPSTYRIAGSTARVTRKDLARAVKSGDAICIPPEGFPMLPGTELAYPELSRGVRGKR